jgi:hypothetical protein
VSPVSGQIRVIIAASKRADQLGDGTELYVVLDETRFGVANVTNGHSILWELLVTVSVGSRLDFVIAPRSSDFDDMTWTLFTITLP